ncbi:DeoR/GlpR family DNA-binding transcription regulator [Mesorhizobium sp. KR1-2]|uniref:DeoR/GlpR family DNA-binding transcription regulator n=1 Tax=Mesorhizobium sp. KR1-2 TaxID=3156609 RepID=UPI0032B444FC
MTKPFRPNERRDRILQMLRDGQRLSVEHLAEELEASKETIRRDLTELAAEGLIRKFHGGASLPEPRSENRFQLRMTENMREKRAVARRAALLFEPGDTLFVDTGTTTVMFAEELARRSGITVITNSVTIAQIITQGESGNRVFVIGGEYVSEAAENLGSLAVEQVGRFQAVHAVITVGAIDEFGVMDFSLEEAEVGRAMIAQARSITVIADSSKLNRMALFRVCPLEEIDRLVIDRAPTGAIAEALKTAGIELLTPADDPTTHPDKAAANSTD